MKVRVTQLERGVDGITRRYDRLEFNPIEWAGVRLVSWQRKVIGFVIVTLVIFAVVLAVVEG